MNITLCNTGSEPNKINKTLSAGYSMTGTLREETNVVTPDILIEIDNPTGYNYAYIPDFGRYYFIREMRSIRNGLWRISLKVDVLMSFRSSILSVPVILSDTESVGQEFYQAGDAWKTKVKEKTDIIPFSSGLSENGHFILITAGGA